MTRFSSLDLIKCKSCVLNNIPRFLANECAAEALDMDRWHVAMLNSELNDSGCSMKVIFNCKYIHHYQQSIPLISNNYCIITSTAGKRDSSNAVNRKTISSLATTRLLSVVCGEKLSSEHLHVQGSSLLLMLWYSSHNPSPIIVRRISWVKCTC